MTVERWQFLTVLGKSTMVADDVDGEWVDYDDYKALEARIEELLQANEKLINLVEGIPVHNWKDQFSQRIKDMPEWVSFYVLTKEYAREENDSTKI